MKQSTRNSSRLDLSQQQSQGQCQCESVCRKGGVSVAMLIMLLLLFHSQDDFQNIKLPHNVMIKVNAFPFGIANNRRRRSSTDNGTDNRISNSNSRNHGGSLLSPSATNSNDIAKRIQSVTVTSTEKMFQKSKMTCTTLFQQHDSNCENNDENNYDNEEDDNCTINHTEQQYSVVIGKGSILNLENDGTLTFSKSLLVEGTLIGNLQCTCTSLDSYHNCNNDNIDEKEVNCMDTSVMIGKEGQLTAHIVNCGVAKLNVQGQLIGDVHCDKLIVGKYAVLIGDIKVRSISIEEGATIIGSITCGVDVVPELQFHNNNNSESTVTSSTEVNDLNIGITDGTTKSVADCATDIPTDNTTDSLNALNDVNEVNVVSDETFKVETHEEKNGFSNNDVNNELLRITTKQESLENVNQNGFQNEDDMSVDVDVNGYNYQDRNGKSSDKYINDLDITNDGDDEKVNSILRNDLDVLIEASSDNGVSKQYKCNGQTSYGEGNESNQYTDDDFEEDKKQGSTSQNIDIGNVVVDHSQDVIIPVANGIESKNGFHKQTASDCNVGKGSDSSLFDDFGNPLFHSPINIKSTFDNNNNNIKKNNSSNKKNYQNDNNNIRNYNNNKNNNNNNYKGKYVDEFGNPLIRGADDDELAGYRQIREISAVTRELLDAHIREKKKKVIEKAARATPQARISRQLDNNNFHMQKDQNDDNDIDNNDMPSFLR